MTWRGNYSASALMASRAYFNCFTLACETVPRRYGAKSGGAKQEKPGYALQRDLAVKEPMTKPDALPFEPRPRDFVARLPRRKVRTLADRAGRSHSGRRGLILLAAVAVPAFAAPEDWRNFDIGNAGEAQVVIEPMPFEKAGDSFPGSAFYYLAASDNLPLAGQSHADNANAPTAIDPFGGPIAGAIRVGASGIDRARALHCLTAAVYYEAASEPDAGQRAVAQVVLNRVAHPSYPGTVCGVVFQGSERRTGCQFSFTCDGALARIPSRFFWMRAESVARAALSGYVERSAGLATHYHTIQVHPYWADSLAYLGTIGLHRFYRFGGAAGAPAAFRFAYLGGEPVAAPHPRSSVLVTAEDPALDPLALQRTYESELKAAQGNAAKVNAIVTTATGVTPARAAPAPVYSQDIQSRGGEALHKGAKLPQASGVRPEYQNSGRWIARPGT